MEAQTNIPIDNTGLSGRFVAVTGADGFIGRNLCEALAKRGFRIRALARSREKSAFLSDLGAETIIGDLRDEKIHDTLLKGVDGVFHLAGALAKFGVYDANFWEVNVTCSKNLLKAATRNGVKRFVHCSTASVMGNIANPPADETAPYAYEDAYDTTKAHGEKAALASNGVKGLSVTVVRPTIVYGPHDTRRLEFFRGAAKGTLKIIGKGATLIHPVYIDDLVEGLILAYQSKTAGGRVYLIGGDRYLPLVEWARIIAREAGTKANFVHLPYFPTFLFTIFCEKVFTLFQLEPPILRRKLSFFIKNRAYSIERAKAELGYAPKVSLEEGARKTIEWYKSRNLL